MLQFLVEGWQENERRIIEASLFELALRMGYRFSIHRSSSTLTSDAFVVRYGSTPASVTFNGIELPVQRSAYTKAGEADLISQGDARIWAVGEESAFDVVAGTADLLVFNHEAGVTTQDKDDMGRILPIRHPFHKKKILALPLLENNAEFLRSLLVSHKMPNFNRHYPFGERKYALSMSHDVDGPRLHFWFALARSAFLGLVRHNRYERESFAQGLLTLLNRRPDPYWNFETWMRIEQQLGMQSEFFFYSGPTPGYPRHFHDPRYSVKSRRFRNLLRNIAEKGWDAGVHFGISAHGKRAYSQARERLSELFGRDVVGGRAHYWATNWDNPRESWENMDAAGFEYDLSLNPINVGFRNGAMLPITASALWRGLEGRPFLAIPTVFMDAYLVPRLATSECAMEVATQVMNAVKKENGLIVGDWHVRSAANSGAMAGMMNPFNAIREEIMNDECCRFLSPRALAMTWREHIKIVFAGVV